VLLFIVLRSIIVSTTSTPYEQWLTGGVVVLSDVAVGVGVVVVVVGCWLSLCCCPETGPVATLQAEAFSGSIGLRGYRGWQVGNTS
jgi:hypothetical protein